MSIIVRIFSLILCFSLLISIFSFSINTVAIEDGTQGYIIGEGVNVREGPNTESPLVTQMSRINIIIHEEVKGQAVEGYDGYDTWYKISNLEKSVTGYVYGIYVKIHSNQDLSADFEKQLESFPESYRDSLRLLKKFYPNWKFVADPVTISFNEAVEQEYSVVNRKQVEMTYKGGDTAWRDPRCFVDNNWVQNNGGWIGASKGAIAYFMDPRNFINPNDVYVFLQQGYNAETQNEAGLRQIVAGTFLEKGYDEDPDAYIKDIMEAATNSGVSPYILASTMIVEQGLEGSDSISGEYPGYEGHYNFFNIGASGEDEKAVITSGLDYAVSAQWNSRKAAIVGGAEFYNNGYIKRGQDTYYYKDFNLVDLDFRHQYAQSVYDAYVSAIRLRKIYIDNSEAALVFKIPIFTEIPAEIAKKPVSTDKPAPPEDTGDSAPDEDSGEEKEETDKKEEVVEKVEPPEPVYRTGDANGDNVINALDLAAVKKHILSVALITGPGLKSVDVNDDGAINALDLAAIKKDILGIEKIA